MRDAIFRSDMCQYRSQSHLVHWVQPLRGPSPQLSPGLPLPVVVLALAEEVDQVWGLLGQQQLAQGQGRGQAGPLLKLAAGGRCAERKEQGISRGVGAGLKRDKVPLPRCLTHWLCLRYRPWFSRNAPASQLWYRQARALGSACRVHPGHLWLQLSMRSMTRDLPHLRPGRGCLRWGPGCCSCRRCRIGSSSGTTGRCGRGRRRG